MKNLKPSKILAAVLTGIMLFGVAKSMVSAEESFPDCSFTSGELTTSTSVTIYNSRSSSNGRFDAQYLGEVITDGTNIYLMAGSGGSRDCKVGLHSPEMLTKTVAPALKDNQNLYCLPNRNVCLLIFVNEAGNFQINNNPTHAMRETIYLTNGTAPIFGVSEIASVTYITPNSERNCYQTTETRKIPTESRLPGSSVGVGITSGGSSLSISPSGQFIGRIYKGLLTEEYFIRDDGCNFISEHMSSAKWINPREGIEYTSVRIELKSESFSLKGRVITSPICFFLEDTAATKNPNKINCVLQKDGYIYPVDNNTAYLAGKKLATFFEANGVKDAVVSISTPEPSKNPSDPEMPW